MIQDIINSILKKSPSLLAFITIISINCLTIFNFIACLRTDQSSLLYCIWVVILVWYTILSLLIIYSFTLLIIKDPGSLESLKCDSNAPNEFKSTIRYCNKCSERKWKPPRAHHCTTCNICIFKMDHHCMLINNCIGYSNQKIYILFLFYSVCSASLTIISSFFLLSKLLIFSLESGIKKMKRALIIDLIINIIIFLTAMIFLLDQIDYISSNSTLVELISNKRGKKMKLINNFKMIFGENKYLWFLPLRNIIKPNFNEELYEIIEYPNNRYFSEIRLADTEQLKSFSELSKVNRK
ncbi:DHHC family palmitoyl transferase with a signal peptide and 4 transmembrane domain [Cryptosporidium sp. chipmunk genotype I]|uniref:DHHC family palmitoyl transferase with a signal peptide and 4 transmembrane domain n=1 Tax=Cryptosporidium sp. chipmunk genotype I TaxID=1280935 RepID=UPI003519E25C|nr:DHHC family palmitoyl transferase with a signal peptide and 4 transmembrane domain [Cryptosporidium sp. chipmunk genotype I]